MYRFSINILIILSFLACKPTQTAKEDTKSNISDTKPQIAYYFFKAFKTADSTYIRLNKSRITNAKLKGNFPSKIADINKKNNQWLVSFSGKQIITQLQIENPLIEKIEYINEQGNFEKRTILHTQKDFVLRIPYNNSIKTITFEQIIKDSIKLKTILISKINP
jgi:hypothetical protein